MGEPDKETSVGDAMLADSQGALSVPSSLGQGSGSLRQGQEPGLPSQPIFVLFYLCPVLILRIIKYMIHSRLLA